MTTVSEAIKTRPEESATETKQATKGIIFKIFRFIPEKDEKPRLEEYKVPAYKGMTVLDALFYIKENIDHSLAYRHSCRMGICGSCGMLINGLPRLACQTQVFELNSDTIEIRPLPNYPIIRDLATDFTNFFTKHKSVKPFIIREDREEQENPAGEYLQTPEQHLLYMQFTYCIKCGLCNAACPIMATDDLFIGPQALAQAYRYTVDNRDQGAGERILILDNPHGVWRCHFAGSCSAVCPKGVDPALAIQLLKRIVISESLGIKKVKNKTEIKPISKEHKPNPKIPEPPPRTVK
ncbi:MAG: succinate dehydrogenase iron-sulfur subunit [Thermoprotei archaeon]